MEMGIKVMAMKAMVTKTFNVPDKYDSDDGTDGDYGEENSDGDGTDEEDRNTAALMIA